LFIFSDNRNLSDWSYWISC